MLNRRIYTVANAARILRVTPSTLMWWLDGRTNGARVYPPVIRREPTGERTLTWAEFVEAGLLRQYRKKLGVRLHEIREFVTVLRQELELEHPLVHSRPWVGEGRRLVVDLQQTCGLKPELCLITPVSGQFLLLPPAESFLQRVDWEADVAAAWRPHDDELSPVRCRPGRRFGRPMIKGISTTAIVEHVDGGESENEVADQFNLSPQEVRWAMAYETSRTTLRAA